MTNTTGKINLLGLTQPQLEQFFESIGEKRFRAGQHVRERWTFYPANQPRTVLCTCGGIELDDGRMAMLVEGRIAHVGTHHELLATVPEYRELLSADYAI